MKIVPKRVYSYIIFRTVPTIILFLTLEHIGVHTGHALI